MLINSSNHTYSDEVHTWSVIDLWREAAKYTPVELPLSEVTELDKFLDSHCWSDGPLSVRGILENMGRIRDADLSYPIILTPSGCIADGCHRLVKAMLEGRKTLLVVKLDSMPEPRVSFSESL